MRNLIHPAAVELGITERIGWHTFRHTYSSLLRATGADIKVMQERLYAGGESGLRLVDSAKLRTECAGAEPRDSSWYQGLGAGEQIAGGL